MPSTAVQDQDAAAAGSVSPRPGRRALFEQLRADGVRYMFGNPGTVEQGFLDEVRDFPDISYVLTLQETIAVAAADGYARAARRPAIVQLHSGVGLGNGIGMLYQARRGHAPLVVFAGESGVMYEAMDAQMAADLVGMARPVTKWATRVVDPRSLLRVVRRAIKIASTPPTGPVFVALPMDVMDAATEEPAVPTQVPSTRATPAAADVAAAAKLLAAAERPMIVYGDGVAFSGGNRGLVEVAEALGADVWGADASEVSIPASHPLHRGLLGHMFGSHSTPIVKAADAVLVVGTYLLPEVFPNLESIFDPRASVVHVDLDAYEIAKNHRVDLGLVADPALTLAALAAALQASMTPVQAAAAARRRAEARARKDREDEAARSADVATWDTTPLLPARFMSELGKRVGGKALVFDEALTTSPELTRYLPPDEPGSYFQTRGGSLGVGIPGAIGIKLAHPDRTVIGFTGDGGSMYTIQALWTAAHHGVGAKFVICNNGSYKLLKANIQQYWRERGMPEHAFPASFDLVPPEIRFDQLSKSLGVDAVRVERPDQISGAIDAMLAGDAPFLVDLVLSDEVPGHAHFRGGQ